MFTSYLFPSLVLSSVYLFLFLKCISLEVQFCLFITILETQFPYFVERSQNRLGLRVCSIPPCEIIFGECISLEVQFYLFITIVETLFPYLG